jgi:hypothetical protein
VSSRLARDDEVATWNDDGWILLDSLIGTDEIDAAAVDLLEIFPTPAEYHADPDGVTEKWLGRPPEPRTSYRWPETGPGFRPEQHRWASIFPLPGSGALNRLFVHPSIVDFAERALRTADVRLYQGQVSAKYTGLVNYEQPMHTDRNHSWLPPRPDAPWRHVEGFLYLSDVEAGTAPTHLVSVRESADRDTTSPLFLPHGDPEHYGDPGLYAMERPAAGPRGSFLAYRSNVFHRGVNLTKPGGSRFLLNVSFKTAGHDWIGYHTAQSRSTGREWVGFVEGSTPRELALFGFPPPGHPIWDAALIDATARLYPRLDITPWRDALASAL